MSKNSNKGIAQVRHDDENSPGMDDIRLVRSANYEDINFRPRDQIVGSFGIVANDGQELLMNWKVSGDRHDKRHGAVEQAEPITRYAKDMLASMFARWDVN